MTEILPVSGPVTSDTHKTDGALRIAAESLEASFLSEMLKAAGLGKTRASLGGGAGEDQFSSFLVRTQAEAIAKSGGIGLAEHLFEALKDRSDDR